MLHSPLASSLDVSHRVYPSVYTEQAPQKMVLHPVNSTEALSEVVLAFRHETSAMSRLTLNKLAAADSPR